MFWDLQLLEHSTRGGEACRAIPAVPQPASLVVVDLHNVAPGQEELVAQYYHGYIPTIAVIDSQGKLMYDGAGETATTRGDTSNLQRLLDSAR